jgi:hypothetical protein
MKPSKAPVPYWIANSVPFSEKEFELLESYLLCKKQAIEVQWVEGTQRLEEPVSNTTVKV